MRIRACNPNSQLFFPGRFYSRQSCEIKFRSLRKTYNRVSNRDMYIYSLLFFHSFFLLSYRKSSVVVVGHRKRKDILRSIRCYARESLWSLVYKRPLYHRFHHITLVLFVATSAHVVPLQLFSATRNCENDVDTFLRLCFLQRAVLRKIRASLSLHKYSIFSTLFLFFSFSFSFPLFNSCLIFPLKFFARTFELSFFLFFFF